MISPSTLHRYFSWLRPWWKTSVCDVAPKCFGIWKTGKCKCMMGLKFCANRNFAESKKIENFFLGNFSKIKRFTWRLDEEFQPEAVQSIVFSSKTIKHPTNRTLSIQAYHTYEGMKEKKSTVKFVSFYEKLGFLSDNLTKEILTVAVLKET